MTYVVLVILIALWAMVLLPPYLKDRRASGRSFRSMQPGSTNAAQRFLPLQQASSRYRDGAASSGVTGVNRLGANPVSPYASSGMAPATGMAPTNPTGNLPGNLSGNLSGNVVQLRPVDTNFEPAATAVDPATDPVRAPLATSAAAYLEEAPLPDESVLHQAWDTPQTAGLGMPSSTAAARERRRQVLLSLTGVAVVTLLLALFAGGRWVAAHVMVDVVMLGYVILLVRHRQLMADRMTKVEPIRPPVSEQAPSSVQLAPSYLLRSKTGS